MYGDTDSEATRRALMRLREGIRRRRGGGGLGEAQGGARDYASSAMDAAFGPSGGETSERVTVSVDDRDEGREAAKRAIDRIFGARKGGAHY